MKADEQLVYPIVNPWVIRSSQRDKPRCSARKRDDDQMGLLAAATWRAADIIRARPGRGVDGGRGDKGAVVDLVCAPLRAAA